MELTKKDWEDVIKQAEALVKEAMLSMEIHNATIEKAQKEIKKFD